MTTLTASQRKTLDAWLTGRLGRFKPGLRLAVGFGLAAGFAVIVQACLLAWIVNAVVMQGARLATVWPALAALPAVFAVRFVFMLTAERASFATAAALRLDIRAQVVRKVLALGPAWIQWQSSGALTSDAMSGVEALEGYYARWLPNRALSVLLPFAVLAVVLPADLTSGLVLLATAPLIPFFMIVLGKTAAELNQRQWARLAQLSARFLDTLQGLTTLKLFDASRREAEMVQSVSDAYRVTTMQVLRIAFLSAVVLEFLATISIAIVAVLIGFHLLYGKIPFERGLFVLLLAPEFYLPLRSLGTHYHARMDAIAAAERLAAILETPGPATASLEPLRPASAYTLQFEAVRHTDAAGHPMLDTLSFAAEPGHVTALVGPTGAGKSTVLNLLLGFISPTSGTIRVNEQPLATLDPESWLAEVAWVPQRAHIFIGSLLDNLLIARPNASLAEVHQAARDAGAHDFIDALPLGYNTPLGERGVGLSGGQIQRLALARAFLKNAPIVLLDEPTAHLDAATQIDVHAAIRRLARDRTVLLVAHRPATARLADRIVVLDAGRAVQIGTHAQLASCDGLYADLMGPDAPRSSFSETIDS
jgi:ATP-binding cassette, subfamily C, bacterial CydD